MQKQIKSHHPDSIIFFSGGLLGAVAFLLLYGTKVLNVNNTEWIFHPVCLDLAQHYFGWAFYRYDDWRFPLGMTNSLAYPFSSSIIFTDSIPHWALLFKFISPILPHNFQYFGIYGLFCLFLQGAFSALLLFNTTNNKNIALLGSIFFLLATPFFRRMFMHTALGSQWLILWSMVLWFEKNTNTSCKHIALWSLLVFFAAGTHITILTMCLIVLFFDSCKRIRKDNRTLPFTTFFIPFLVSVITVYLYGGFTSETNPISTVNDNGGLGWYGANINALINPIYESNSTLIRPMPIKYFDDGYCYLGLGAIVMFVISLLCYLIQNRKYLVSIIASIVPLLIMLSFFCLFSFSPRITLGNNILFEYTPPKLVLWIWEVFRSSGRFIWPVYYFILAYAIIICSRVFSNKLQTFFLLLMLTIQLIDIGPGIYNICQNVNKQTTNSNEIDPRWKQILNEKKFVFLSNTVSLLDNPELLDEICKRKIKINTFYFAHADKDYQSMIESISHDRFKSPSNNAVYLFRQESSSFIDSCKVNLSLDTLDNIIIGTKQY